MELEEMVGLHSSRTASSLTHVVRAGPAQYEDKKTKALMMLPCAVSSIFDDSTDPWPDLQYRHGAHQGQVVQEVCQAVCRKRGRVLQGVSRILPSRLKAGFTDRTPHSFSAAFAKLLELGVPTVQFAGDAWQMGSQ